MSSKQGGSPPAKSVRRARLIASTALAALLTSSGAALAAEAASGDASDVGEVVVTGSRIQVTGMRAPTPVTVLSQTALSDIAPGNIAQAVLSLPQFFNNTQPSTSGPIGAALGATTVNLRGLGANRTLTMLNGRRMVPFNQIGTVDISMFPSALTQRIDVVTGGASAAFGTDAVGGVVNYVLNTKFEGVDLRLQGGESDRGDNFNGNASLAFGKQLGSKLHVLGSVDYNRSQEIPSYFGRDWFQSWGLVTDPTNPLRLLSRPQVVATLYTCGGLITQANSALNRLEFLPDGSTAPFRNSTLGTTTGQGAQSIAPQYGGGSGCDVKAQGNRANSVSVQPGQDRVSTYLYADYAVSDNLKLFVQGLYGHTWLITNGNSTIMQGTLGATIFRGNPYLPANVQQTMTTENLPSFGYSRYATTDDLANGRIVQKNNTISLTTGFEANLPGLLGGWKVNGYYQYGRNKNDQIIHDFVRIDRVYLALDAVRDPATGNIVCNAALANPTLYGGCVPLNLFGAGRASRAAIDWVEGPDRDTRSFVTEHDVELAASGKIMDGWAGPIDGALGFDYRHLSLDQKLTPVGILSMSVPSNNTAQGIRGIPAGSVGSNQVYQFSSAFDAAGKYDVKEGFAEINLPLLANMPAVQHFDLDLAARVADYSGSGTIWAYKGGVNWTVYNDLRFRGTLSRDVRAATLQERFNNQGAGGAIRDPLRNNQSYTPTIFTGGNPNVKPEKSDTVTLGTVYQPSWFRGFSASLDWYKIKINGAISQLSAQDILNQCVGGSQQACSFITRIPPAVGETVGLIQRISSTYLNVNQIRVSGVDLELGYNRALKLFGGPDETIGVRLLGSYLHERGQKLESATQIDDAVGDIGAGYPKYRGQGSVTYNYGRFKVFAREQYVGSGIVSRNYVIGSATNTNGTTVDDNHVEPVWYTDLHFTYSPKTKMKLELYFNIDNLFDRDPPIVPSFSLMGGSGPTNLGLYDQIGRRFLAGAHVVF